jgi:phosphoribosylformylglycinamidine cyclo-ligase
MFNTYNMGIGFVIAADSKDAQTIIAALSKLNYPAWEIGCVEEGGAKVRFV